jgi:hypothetical protein
VDVADVDTYLAVSACHPNPGYAKWRTDEEEARFLCLGHVAATNYGTIGDKPGLYLIHRCCNDVIADVRSARSLFDCVRALGPILQENLQTIQRTWPWTFFSNLYAPILRSIFSKTTGTKTAAIESIRNKFEKRFRVITAMKKYLQLELSDMILDYLPCQLAVSLLALSGEEPCFQRLRKDPIARRFELASQILGHKTRHTENKINLEAEMVLDWVKLGRHWILRDLFPARQDISGQTQSAQVQQSKFTHCHDRRPWIAIQVSEYGITHIAFEMEAGRPRWTSPNAVDSKAAFFQDSGSVERFDFVVVISDVRELHKFVDIEN